MNKRIQRMKNWMPAAVLAVMITAGCQQARVVNPDMAEGQSYLMNPGCQTTYALVSEEGIAAVPLILMALDRYSGETNAQRRCLIIQGALWNGSNCTNSQFQTIIKRGSRDPSEAVREKTNKMLEKARQQAKRAARVEPLSGGAIQVPKPPRADVPALFDTIVKKFNANLPPEELSAFKNKRFVVTEYEVENLWDMMGVQLFGLSDTSERDLDYFAYSNGELKQLDVFTFGGSGIGGAVVSGGFLYFTYGAGSGIYRVNLYKVGRDKGNALTHENMGSITSDPPDPGDTEFAKKMQDIIGTLKPVKKGKPGG